MLRPAPAGIFEPLILLADPDPHLALLLERHISGSRVLQVTSERELPALLALKPNLAIVRVGSPRDAALQARPDRPKILGLVEDSDQLRERGARTYETLLRKPFTPRDLVTAVQKALRLPGPRRRPNNPPRRRPHWVVASSRLGALALAASLEVTGRDLDQARAAILLAALLHTVVPIALKHGARRTILDLCAAAALIALTGGPDSPYWPLGLVACAEAGFAFGSTAGTLGGGLVAVASLSQILASLHLHGQAPLGGLAWVSLFVLAGLVGGLASWIAQIRERGGPRILDEANRVLSTLHGIARAMPGGLEIGSVTSAALDEVHEALGSPAAALLLEGDGACRVEQSYGIPEPEKVVIRLDAGPLAAALEKDVALVRREQLLPEGADPLGLEEWWFASALIRDERRLGLLLVACPREIRHGGARSTLRDIADETALAVENALLFRHIRELSIDEERQRLARDLHDGVAQALTHIRLELDFLGRHAPLSQEAMQDQVRRLGRVVERAIIDVRSTIVGLRANPSEQGLFAGLGSYLKDLQGLVGPEISFAAEGEPRLPAAVEAELFRIAQGAVSNAVRHARARTISVTLDATSADVRLRVEDDGAGFRPGRHVARAGSIGLAAMRERAERIGARVNVLSRAGAGTIVEVVCPVSGGERPQPNGEQSPYHQVLQPVGTIALNGEVS